MAINDFAKQSAAELINEYDNLLVIKTTSKSRALAGLRVGYALGNEALIQGLIRMKDSFNSYTIDRLALAGALASFEDKDYFTETTEKIIQTREKVSKELESLGFHVLPSEANFVFVKHEREQASELYEKLLEKDTSLNKEYINDIQIGYYLNFFDDNHSLILEPSWYILYQDDWIRIYPMDFEQNFSFKGGD